MELMGSGKMMQGFRWGLMVVLAAGLRASPALAATSTASASVQAEVAARASLILKRDDNSVTGRGGVAAVVFDKFDDQDGQADGNAGFMYAPYRSETGKNWHVADIIANGSQTVLTASVAGTAGSKDLKDILSVFTGGFFSPGATTPLAGTASTDWEALEGFRREVGPFTGTAPLNYRLEVAGVQGSATPYTGTITFTLTSN